MVVKKIIEALKVMGVFFETNINTITLLNQRLTIEHDDCVAISFGKKKNNPILLISGFRQFLFAKNKFFDLSSRKLISELQFAERFFSFEIKDDEELVIELEEGIEITFDLHAKVACGGKR